jgi:hypothetical protein
MFAPLRLGVSIPSASALACVCALFTPGAEVDAEVVMKAG